MMTFASVPHPRHEEQYNRDPSCAEQLGLLASCTHAIGQNMALRTLANCGYHAENVHARTSSTVATNPTFWVASGPSAPASPSGTMVAVGSAAASAAGGITEF
eukprot:m.122479 g.122479  ORF g.122479 m.122479 type:complete len:103 (+) comp13419_c0_seq2:3795-4103(+)